jgi:transcriptional regulator with XRE-family HTH domain
MQFNYSKLLGRFREYGFAQKEVAARIGIQPSTLSQKLKNKANFTSNEIDSMCKLLDIEKEDIGIYFFTV